MSRVNGIGTAYLGFSEKDEEGAVQSTLWFTFLYLLLVPLRSERLRIADLRLDGMEYTPLERRPLQMREVLRTYLGYWIARKQCMDGLLTSRQACRRVTSVNQTGGSSHERIAGVGRKVCWWPEVAGWRS
jgi:hypothetical protein